jgi:hypothetical protein
MMKAVDQSKRRRVGRIGGRARMLLSAVALMGLVGCANEFGRKLASNDPLVGGSGSTPPPNPTLLAPPSNGPAQAQAVVRPPQLPSTFSAPGTVAVAGGETGTPDNGRDSLAARGVAPVVTVGNPEPASSNSTARLTPLSPGATAPASVGGAAANVRTFEEAQQFLKRYGVSWQRLDQEDDGRWQFQCSIPNPKSTNTNRTYGTDGPFSDPVSAMRAVLAKIEQQPR